MTIVRNLREHDTVVQEQKAAEAMTTMKNPRHPGRIVREDQLPELGLSVGAAAEASGVSRQTLDFADR